MRATSRSVWKRLYDPRRGHRIPALLLSHAKQAIAAVVDEIAFQPRRALAERALATIIPFAPHDHQAIRAGGEMLVRLRAPRDLPPRFLVSAAAYAIEKGVDTARPQRARARHPRSEGTADR